MSRVLFFCHDNPKPAGGIRTLYRQVQILNQNRIEAYVVHSRPGFSLSWFAHDVPVLYLDQKFKIADTDWIIIPEDYRAAIEMCATVQCNKVIFCQNHFYIFNGLTEGRSWKDFGIDYIFASSHEIQNYIQDVFGLNSILLPYAIDHDVFYPDKSIQRLQIAYMPRKGQWNLQITKGILWHKYPHLRTIPWVAIDNINEQNVADLLRSCSVFLSTGFMEGFGLPPIEAMACGAMVVGFKAGGGKDFATAENGFWVPDEDPIGLAHELASVLTELQLDPDASKWDEIRRAAHTTSQQYCDRNTKEAVLGFWRRHLNG